MPPASPIEALDAFLENETLRALLTDAAARSNGRHTFASLVEEIVSGSVVAFIRKKSFIAAQVLEYPAGARWLQVRIGAGHMNTLKSMMKDVEEYARDRGCVGVESVARKGWARIGEKLGYDATHVFLERML